MVFHIPVQGKPNSMGGKPGFGPNDRKTQGLKTILGPNSSITLFI